MAAQIDVNRSTRLATLALLYIAQGLPFGFQATALRAYLRQSGVSLTGVGLVGALSLPWMGKALWAPLVDRYGSTRFGRRKSWILPLTLLLAFTTAAASLVPPTQNLPALLTLVFFMNLLAATQDIAVDGLAVDLLGPGELGPANAAQVMGYKIGMLTGGGLLVWASQYIGWRGLFLAMATLIVLTLPPLLFLREPPPSDATEAARRSLRELFVSLLSALTQAGAGWLLLFVATYKLGEAMVDAMFTPFLIDAGFSPPTLGLWVGTWGMVASLLGSLAGGALAAKRPFLTAVGVAGLLRSLSMLGECALAAMATPMASAVVAVTIAEHFFGGMLTTTMFAFMMSRVSRKASATHFTLLASIEVIGKSPGAWLSGLFAERFGYLRLFVLGTALSFAFLLLLAPLRASESKGDAQSP